MIVFTTRGGLYQGQPHDTQTPFVRNFLAFLGWNPGTQQEIFSMEELANEFSVERIGKSGTRFDIQKAKWFNEQYLRAKPDAELAGYLLKALEEHGITCSTEKAEKIAGLMPEHGMDKQRGGWYDVVDRVHQPVFARADPGRLRWQGPHDRAFDQHEGRWRRLGRAPDEGEQLLQGFATLRR